MIRFESTTDTELVRSIITHPKLYSHLVDDFSPAAEEFRPEARALYVLVRDGGTVLGVFMFVPHSTVCWEVHTCLLPCSWGARAVAAAKGCSEWIWAHTGCRRIVTAVPAYNRLALRLAERAGMQRYGNNPRSFLRWGELHDQIMLGLSRPEEN